MKRIILALLLCSVVGLAGCGSLGSNVKEFSGVVSSLLTLSETHQSVRDLVLGRVDTMTAEDRDAVLAADAEIELLRELAGNLVEGGNAARLVANVQRARLMWSTARSAYTSARGVVAAPRNFDKFTPQQKRQLEIYDRQAQVLNASVEALLEDPSNARAVQIMSTTLEVGAAAARILLLL